MLTSLAIFYGDNTLQICMLCMFAHAFFSFLPLSSCASLLVSLLAHETGSGLLLAFMSITYFPQLFVSFYDVLFLKHFNHSS